MKHFQIIAILLGILLSSCDLTLLPEDKISPEIFFGSAQELELWTNQFYTILDGADAAAGQAVDDNVSRTMGAVISGTRSAADESGWTWTRLRAINYCLQNMGNCTDDAAKTKYTAVCYFFRAYFYFQKVQRYGDVPWYDQVLKSTDDELLYKVREDRGFVMDKVMDDLDNAVTLFSSLPSEKSISRITKWTVLAFKSRAALYEGTFRKYHGLPDADKY
ncbi:MAG: RagB/SusD family nutrient uptake outer membrane protein, partial [Dysgonamonadaceae bacterium]|nr:RagB/SusD family nutrient uptake outer membrane protein [Dysgonamonadaceae bacterium]